MTITKNLIARFERIDSLLAPGESDPDRMAALLAEISLIVMAGLQEARDAEVLS
jgi:hypothetical protein